MGANSGQCVDCKDWGVKGAKDPRDGFEASCKDDSDKYRPIRQPVRTEPLNNDQVTEKKDTKGENHENVDGEEHRKVEPQGEEVWKSMPRTSEGKNYVKDLTTGLHLLSVTKETCRATNGFICKVSLQD